MTNCAGGPLGRCSSWLLGNAPGRKTGGIAYGRSVTCCEGSLTHPQHAGGEVADRARLWDPRANCSGGMHGEGRSVTQVMATREVARAVGLMTDEQRARLGCLLMELDTAEVFIAQATRAHARAQVELAAAQTVKQRRLDAIESLIASVGAPTHV